MPNPISFKPVTGAKLTRLLGKEKQFSAQYPKRAVSKQQLNAAARNWRKTQRAAAIPVVENKINAVRLSSAQVGKLAAISASTAPTGEAIQRQKLGPDQTLNILYSSLAALEMTKMESELQRRSRAAKTPAQRKKVQDDWARVVKAGRQAFSAAGLSRVTEADLRRFSSELRRSKKNFDAVVKIANSGVALAGGGALTASTAITGAFVPVLAEFDPGSITTVISDLCDKPFAEGKFTKHFSRSFSLTVRLTVWCPTWTNPFRTCKKNFTIAGVSFSIGLEVGYRVTCCGAVVWGQAYAQACGTILGITLCAGCTAQITGVAGIGRTGSGSSCTYGIGVNAKLEWKFGGVTVFSAQAPFGFNVSGPCPPAGLCK
jgi:hypothetical protein